MSDRIEMIIKEYPQLIMERTCLENQINNFSGISETEMIDSMSFTKLEGDRVQVSVPSERTALIAINYKSKMEKINREWIEHLEKKHAMISEELIFFESAVSALSENLPGFMSDMVIRGLTWDNLACKYHISRTMVAKYRKKAIRELETLYEIHDKEMEEYILG